MVASGNDFVIVSPLARLPVSPLKDLAKKICDRKYGIGADGLLVLRKSRVADVRMRIFNADGSEAQMCGNGARCVAYYLSSKLKAQSSNFKIETKAGVIYSKVCKDNVKIKLTDPKNIKLDIPLKVNNRSIKVNFVDTGVPHTVIFTEGLDKIDVREIGRFIRFHKKFAPRGTNANFIEILSRDAIKVRTYERGVEDETLACGTGSVASAVIFSLKTNADRQVKVHTKGGEILTVYFTKMKNKYSGVWLEGKARIVYKGAYNV